MAAPEGAGAREIGRLVFTAEEITRFARQFDPQPFHVDPAAPSPFGGLVASGWHVVCAWMGFFVRGEGALARAAAGPEAGADDPAVISPVGVGFGLKDLRWIVPVRPGDEIIFLTEVLEQRASASRPGWVIQRRRNSARRGDGTEVMSFDLSHFAPAVGVVPAAAGDGAPPPP